MKIKTLILLVACTPFLTTSASALILNATFSPTLDSGSDTEGFEGSTWSFIWTFDQDTYGDSFDTNGWGTLVSKKASLTIRDALDLSYNKRFLIFDRDTVHFLAIPNSEGQIILGVNSFRNESTYDFGDPEITSLNLSIYGNTLIDPAPVVGSLVLASHFDDALVNGGFVDICGGTYKFGLATVTVVPEPATFGVLVGLSMMVFVIYHRRQGL